MVLDRFTDALAQTFHAGFITGQAHDAEGIVAQAGQGNLVAGLFPKQGGEIAQQQIRAGDADLALHAQEIIQGNVGKGAGLVVFASRGDSLGQGIHQVLTIVQAGQQILAADLFQLFLQLCITVFRLQNDLGAGLSVVGGCGHRHGDIQFVVVTAARGAVQSHAIFALFGERFHELLVFLLAFRRKGIEHRNTNQLVDVVVAQEFHVGLVGIDVHAIVDVGNGILGTFQQQLATLLGLTQMRFQYPAFAALIKSCQLPLDHQNELVGVLKGYGILGTGTDDVDGTLAAVFLGQQNEGDVLVHALDHGQSIVCREFLFQVACQQQVPVGGLERFFQIFFRGNPVSAGSLAGVAEQADHGFRIVL